MEPGTKDHGDIQAGEERRLAANPHRRGRHVHHVAIARRLEDPSLQLIRQTLSDWFYDASDEVHEDAGDAFDHDQKSSWQLCVSLC